VPPILGSVTTHHGWPFVEAAGVDKIAAAGLNYTAERAPGIADDRGPGFEVYERVPGTASRWAPPLSPSAVLGLLSASSPGEAEARAKLDGVFNQSPALRSVLMRGVKIPAAVPKYDLTKFSKVYQEKLRAETAHKLSKGVYVNRGLWDCWIAIHRDEFPIWWVGPYNVNGVDLMKVDDFRQAPHPVILAHVREEVRVSGAFPNVVYELGNEAYRCKPTAAFVNGIREAVRSAEREFGYVKHLWSPGSRGPLDDTELGSEYDFISAHGSPRAAGVVPIEVNEFAPQCPDQYLADLGAARRLGTPAFHFWWDDNCHGGAWDDPALEEEWVKTLPRMKGAPETTGCTNIPNEDAVAVTPRPPANPTWADAINSAMRRLRPDCEINSSCALEMPMQEWLQAVAEEARKGDATHPPICAGVQVDAEGPVDQACFGTENLCQGHHIFSCRADGCHHGFIGWAPGSYTNRNGDTWRRPDAPPTGCPAGTPPPSKYIVGCRIKSGGLEDFCDATPKVHDRDYCAPNLDCPYHGGEGSTERIACERALAWPVWSGATVREDNPFSSDAPRGVLVRVCGRDAPSACGEVMTP
jgi:hypothetical protein